MAPDAPLKNGTSRGVVSFFSGPWAPIIPLLFAAASYLGILRNDFTYVYDDKALILDNPYVHSFQHVRELLTGTLFSNLGVQGRPPYYRPMANFSFLLCYQLFGPAPYGFHLASLLLHSAATGLLFLVAERILNDRMAAFFAACLFALHPVHVEAVAWISSMTDIEVTVFCLLAFLCFLQIRTPNRGRTIWAMGGMTASFVLALFSKEQAVALPILATIYEHFYSSDRSETARWQKILRYGPLWLACVAYVLWRVRIMGSIARSTLVNPITVRQTILSAFALIGQYLGKLLWPLHLTAFNTFRVSNGLFEWPVLLGGFALALCGALFYLLWKRARPASFGIPWLLITLAPVLNARWMSAYVLGERYLYLPSVGFCLIAGWACGHLWRLPAGQNRKQRALAVAGACVVAALCALRIGWRVQDWRDDVGLFTRTLAEQPGDFRLHDALGSAHWLRHDANDAEREWLEALRLQPIQVNPLTWLGALYAEQKRFDRALPYLERAVRLSPDNDGAHLNLGAAYAETGRLDLAEEQFRTAVAVSPVNLNSHNVLGKLYYDSNRLAEAEQQFRQSLQCEPNVAAFDYLGYIYMRWGDQGRAEKAFRSALAINSTDSRAHYNLGLICAATQRNELAVAELQAALAADPHNPEIASALAKVRR